MTATAEPAGLAAAEAARRLAQFGPNELVPEHAPSPWRLLLQVLAEPMIGLLAAVGAVYLALGDREQGAVLLASIVLVVLISFVQTRRAERALAALRGLASPRALVLRDGVQVRIAGRDVVPGDLLLLHEGDRVAADAQLLDARNLVLDESMLSGESVPVAKFADAAGADAGTDASDPSRLFAGTLVVGGHGQARVDATGARTVMGGIGAQVDTAAPRASLLQRETRQLVWIAAAVGIVLSALLALLVASGASGVLDGVLAGLTLAIALLPEEMPIVLSLFFALGAWRISRQQVLTRHLPAVEALGSVSVLCVDKTGTLTENRMRLQRVLAAPGHTAAEVVRAALWASPRDPFDPMEQALARQADTHGVVPSEVYGQLALQREYPLIRRRLAVVRVWLDPASAVPIVAAKGSPEAVADLARLDSTQRSAVLAEVNVLAALGLRVLGIAQARADADALPDDPAGFHFEWLGAVAFADPIRSDVPQAVQACRSAGVKVVMITGDYATTARAIAAQAGLGSDAPLVRGDQLSAAVLLPDFAATRIFCRVTPQQKLDIVQALRARGHVVAMTGDGVNDAPALHSADVGIAMGERGTDVARESADLVLMDDSFASIAAAIRLGRRLYDNLRQAYTYLLAVHVPIAGVALLPPLLGLPPLLWPVHIVFLEFIIDPACTLVFEAEREDDDVMARPPRPAAQRLVDRRMLARAAASGLVALAAVLLAAAAALRQGLPEAELRALVFTGLVTTNLALLLATRSQKRSLWRTLATRNLPFIGVALLALGATAIAIWTPAGARLFGMAAPGPGWVVTLLALVVAATAAFEWIRRRTLAGSMATRSSLPSR